MCIRDRRYPHPPGWQRRRALCRRPGGDEEQDGFESEHRHRFQLCLLYTSPSPRDRTRSRMPSSA